VRPVFLSLTLVACAAVPDKMSWREAMKSAKASVDPVVKSDPSFEAALRAFIDASQGARKGANGGAMPAAQAEAWVKLLAQVDAFVAKPTAAPLDLARARVVVEGELEFDAQTYGDIAPQTAAAAQNAVRRLTARLNERLVLTRRPRVDPHNFGWPVTPVLVSSPFGDRVHPLSGTWRAHRGVDVVADLGQPVRAAYSGTVVFSGWNGAHGKQVHLVHDAHWSTRYSHLSGWHVQAGETVTKGQVIGFAGSTGQSTGPHVHFELLHEGEPVDPEAELPEPVAPSLVSWAEP
jgi:murein DD-endopeptidase MepM/ murein hydrolase activator NlpD